MKQSAEKMIQGPCLAIGDIDGGAVKRWNLAAPPNGALQLTLDPGAATAIASAAPASSAAELCC